MKTRWTSLALLALAVLWTPGVSAAPAGDGAFVLRGPVQVLSAKPFNPAGKDRLFTRITARVEKDRTGQPTVVLTHVYSGQTCRFEAWRSPAGNLLLDGAAPCRFEALGSPGTLKVTEGRLSRRGGRMTLESTFDIRWLNYRGVIRVSAGGGPEVAAR
jgi:hypothetical protein